MIVRWTPTALADLESVHDYIASGDLAAAKRTVARLLDAIDALTRHPAMGRKGRIGGTRELIAAPYIVAYAIREDRLEILSILHGARRWPDRF